MRSRKVEVPLSVTRGEEDFDLVATCSVGAAVAARTSGPPERWAPGESAEVEVLSVVHDGGPQAGRPWHGELTELEERDVQGRAVELALEEAADDEDSRGDVLFDEARDAKLEGPRARWGHD
jgi:hypothetical protein